MPWYFTYPTNKAHFKNIINLRAPKDYVSGTMKIVSLQLKDLEKNDCEFLLPPFPNHSPETFA